MSRDESSLGKGVEKLLSKAFELLEAEDFDGALKVGERLRKLQHTSSFEVLALAYGGKGEKGRAIEVLEEGVGLAPDVWLLWQLLGNFYSDEQRYEDAYRAYGHAIASPNAHESSVNLNWAIAYHRAGKFHESLERLDEVEAEELKLGATLARIEVFNSLGRYDDAIHLAEETLRASNGGDRELEAGLHGSLAYSIWYRSQDVEAALGEAWQAISLNKRDPTAMYLVREIENVKTPEARVFMLSLRGEWPEPFEGESERYGFYTDYDVVAETVEEAFAFAKRFEPEDIRRSLSVDHFERGEHTPDLPKGVYHSSGYAFFPMTDEETVH